MSMAEYVKKGDRIKLMYTRDQYTRLHPGSLGTVTRVDHRRNTVGVKWDDGSTLTLLLEEGDDFDIVAQGPES